MRDMDVQSGAVTSAMRDGVDEAPDVCCGTCAAWATLDGCAGICTNRLDAYTCDCCGAEVDDKARVYVTVSFNGEVWYEWWVCGDYCNECGELLADAIVGSIQMPERYDEAFRDEEERVCREVEMIEERR